MPGASARCCTTWSSNAVKFTDARRGRRSPCAMRRGKTRRRPRWNGRVRDTGIGIAAGTARHAVRCRSCRPTARSPAGSAGRAWDWRSASSWSTQMGGAIGVNSTAGRGQPVPVPPDAAAGAEHGRRRRRSARARRALRRACAALGPADAGPAGGGQSNQPVRRAPAAEGLRRSRSTWRATESRRCAAAARTRLRHDLHGHAHAGDGRAGGDAGDPRTGEGRRAGCRSWR